VWVFKGIPHSKFFGGRRKEPLKVIFEGGANFKAFLLGRDFWKMELEKSIILNLVGGIAQFRKLETLSEG